jgi:hypothetical protein
VDGDFPPFSKPQLRNLNQRARNATNERMAKTASIQRERNMTEQHASNRLDDSSRDAAPKRIESAAIELVEEELKRVGGGAKFYAAKILEF